MGVWRRWGRGKREIIYLLLHCHHQNDFCIKMGSDESHFNVSVGTDGRSHKTVSTTHNLFEEKGEPKWYRTEILPLTSLTPYHWAKPAHRKRMPPSGICTPISGTVSDTGVYKNNAAQYYAFLTTVCLYRAHGS